MIATKHRVKILPRHLAPKYHPHILYPPLFHDRVLYFLHIKNAIHKKPLPTDPREQPPTTKIRKTDKKIAFLHFSVCDINQPGRQNPERRIIRELVYPLYQNRLRSGVNFLHLIMLSFHRTVHVRRKRHYLTNFGFPNKICVIPLHDAMLICGSRRKEKNLFHKNFKKRSGNQHPAPNVPIPSTTPLTWRPDAVQHFCSTVTRGGGRTRTYTGQKCPNPSSSLYTRLLHILRLPFRHSPIFR